MNEDIDWLLGIDKGEKERFLKSVLETTAEQTRSWETEFRDLAGNGVVCVIGPEAAIAKCEDLEIVKL